MPFYTFKCRKCDLKETYMRKMGDFKEPLCPKCAYDPHVQGIHELMEKVVSDVAKPQFKGSGFYETDYKRKKG